MELTIQVGGLRFGVRTKIRKRQRQGQGQRQGYDKKDKDKRSLPVCFIKCVPARAVLNIGKRSITKRTVIIGVIYNGEAGPPVVLWSAGEDGDGEDLSDVYQVAVLNQAVDLANFDRVAAVRVRVGARVH